MMRRWPSPIGALCWSVAIFAMESLASDDALDHAVVPGSHWQRVSSPAEVGWSTERLLEAKAYSESIDTTAVVIVQDGKVVDEWGDTALPLNCHSIRKSLLSALYGRHVESGKINLKRSLRELGINDNNPSLTEEELDATIASLLKARSGIYHPALYETKAMAAARPARGSHGPDTFWYYNNWDFNAAGTIFQHLTGKSLFEEFEDCIAEPLGFEDFERVRDTSYVTGKDSVHAAYPIELSARDLARFGLLFLRGGRWGDQQIIPSEWVRESTRAYSDAGPSGGYGYMWWVAVDGQHFPDVTLPDSSYSARGSRGQYLVVIPEWDLVICHRVNSFESGREVSKSEFGRLLSKILSARPPSPVAKAEVDQRVAEVMEKHGVPGASIAVACNDQIVYASGFGLADVENSVPVTKETRFRTASVAKPLTAAVVLSLVEKGTIDLDAEVQTYCKSFPVKQWPVTVRQVLGHLGGVRHYKDARESSSTDHYFSLESALTTFAGDPLLHEPGTKYLYSSFGYNLLGSIAEAASGENFMNLLQENVLGPAGMIETVRDDQFTIIPNRASGYIRPAKALLAKLPADHDLVAGELYNASLHDTSMKIPGGGLLSTSTDLVRFGIAMNSGKLVRPKTRQVMWTSQKTTDGKETGYGHGWRISQSAGRKVIWHSGGQAGTSTVLLIVPETASCVSVMCNLQDVNLYGLALAVADVFPPSKSSLDDPAK